MITVIVFAFILGAAIEGVSGSNHTNNGDLCFSRNDSQKLDTLIDLVTGVVAIKCNRHQNTSVTPCPRPRPIDCADIRAMNNTRSGNYTIYPNNRIQNSSVEVYCDMEDEDGGWTLLQRRGYHSGVPSTFYRPWADYKRGFGNASEDYWLGNDNIYALTNQRSYRLKFVLTDWANVTVNATYEYFYIADEANDYKYTVGSYNGTAGDSFSNRQRIPFSTSDRNARDCARSFRAGWWYLAGATYCTETNLNGNYWRATDNGRNFGGITWCTFRGDYYSLKYTEMKVKPIQMPVF